MNIGELCSSCRTKPSSTSSLVAADKTLKGEGIKPGEWEKKLTDFIDSAIVIQNNIDGGFDMQTVTVSPKYQVVIPKVVREALRLRPGQKMQVVAYGGRIELIPERDIKELRGFLKGINTEFKREEDRI